MNDPKNLLVVGDWVLDDNWQTGIHRSSTSLRTGQRHHRALHKPGTPVQAFCGAGRVASILYDARRDQDNLTQIFAIHGLGVWRHDADGTDDTKRLESMFEFEFRKRQSPYSLESTASANVNIHLHNLAAFLRSLPQHEKEHFTTTRAYRVFQRRENRLTLLARTDWEQSPKNRDSKGAPEWILESDSEAFRSYLNKLRDEAKIRIDGIIVKDLIKGVITEALIKVLAEEYPRIPWFVSTKRWHPPWLNVLSKVNLKLFLIPRIAANTALNEWGGEEMPKSGGLDSWIAPAKAKPTWGAMKCIGSIEKSICPDLQEATAPIVAVSPRDGSVLAKRGKHFVVHDGIENEGAHLVGWATAFFSTLCASLLEETSPATGLNKLMDLALNFASEWADSEAGYLKEPDADPKDIKEPARLYISNPISPRCDQPQNWQQEWRNWDEATRTHGVINDRRIELWRGMTAVKGYICFEPKKRKHLSHLAAEMRDCAHGIEVHQAVQLLAPPGSGKTHLVRCLAKAANLQMLSFNISQMNRREDIVSCFDTIVTTQASEKLRPLLVFFDEINCKIANQHVYDAFLSPLEESVYVRGGLKFHIKPCVWVFAGTTQHDGQAPDFKYKDFTSRLNLGIVELGKMLAIEKAYLGAQLVRARFPDVRRVSRDALELFAADTGDVRELRNLVNRLHNVQNSQISKANFPGGTTEPAEKFVDID
jgi:hypothetical protein